MHENLYEVHETEEEQVRLGKESIISFNKCGCDEIMCQFMKDIDLSFDIDNGLEFEEAIEPDNYSGVNIETIEE